MKRRRSVARSEFVRRYIQNCGLTYVQAAQVYDETMGIVEDAIICGDPIKFGRVCSLRPVLRPPRVIHQGFKRKKGNVIEKTSCEIHMGSRIVYKVILFKDFLNRASLRWLDR